MSIGETVVVDEGGQRNALPVLLGILGGVVILALLWLFVISPMVLEVPLASDGAAADPDGVAVTDGADDEPTEAATGPTDLTAAGGISRDPFEPVREDPEAEDATAAGTGDQPATVEATVGPAADGDPDGDAIPDPDASPSPGEQDAACFGGEQQMTCDGMTLTLADAQNEGGFSAVRIDTAVYDVLEGDVFAEFFALLAVNDPCVTIFYDTEVFNLCEGEGVLK